VRSILYVAMSLVLAVPAFAADKPPAPAAAVGYNVRTFGPSVAVGSDWHRFGFMGTDPSATNVTQNPDGSVTIAGGGNTFNAQLSSAHPNGGIAFGGGGYFEANLSWEGNYNGWGTQGSNGWPAFWANDIERMSGGKNNGIEVDVMEAWGNDRWGGAVHNWYGSDGHRTEGKEHTLPSGASPSQPHRYGMLWVPATDTARGYVKFYFDGQELKGLAYSWKKGAPNNPAVPKDFSALDGLHLALILGSGSGNPMKVYSVEVWQRSAAQNVGKAAARKSSGSVQDLPKSGEPSSQQQAAELQQIEAEIASTTADINALEARTAQSSGHAPHSNATVPPAGFVPVNGGGAQQLPAPLPPPLLSPAVSPARTDPPIAQSEQPSVQQELAEIKVQQAVIEHQIADVLAEIARMSDRE
jgi:hypothetical protein